MSSVRGSLRRSRRPGPGSSPLGAGTLGAGASPRPSLSSLSSLGSDHPDGVHGVLDSLMGEGAKMQPKYALEDYIYEVQARAQGDMADHHHLHHLRPGAGPGQGEPGDQQQGEDVYAELQRKEKDLILAAELGKALLEKNEELSRQNERIAEEFSQKLEVLEQDRHALRRKLAATASEADSRLLELQADVRELQRAVEDREAALRSTEREKAALVAELTEQNARLSAQLKESNKTEEQLTAQLQGLRDQCNLRKSSLQDHQSSLEMLRDEINMLSDKKAELERRMASLLAERDQLNALLEDANERIMLLERTTREQEMQLRQNRRELDEIRLVNSSLTTSPSSSPLSLPHGLAHAHAHGHRSLLDEMECEDSSESGFVSTSELQSLKEEAVASYRQLRDLARRLRKDKDDASLQGDSQSESDSLPSIDENNCSKFKTGQLGEAVRDVARLVGDLVERDVLEGEAAEVELHRAREDLDKTKRQLEERTEELKRRSDQVMELTSKLSIREAELAGAQEERDRARADLDETHLAKDEIVRKAWEVRDGAVARKNKVEVQLAKTRIDVLQANSQLMEAIQQKVELSQQLEQWQMDMQALLDEQMRRKLTTQEQRSRQVAPESSPEATGAANDKKRTTSSLRLFGLFQR